jgi:hypothetical protein
MGEQHRELRAQRPSARDRLPSSRGNAHDDVAEQLPGVLAVVPFQKGEGQDVGRPILPPVTPIEFLDLIVPGENDRYLIVCAI